MKKTLFLFLILLSIFGNAQNAADIAQTFGSLPGFNNSVNAIVVQLDGKILMGGIYTSYNQATENRIIRLNADGTKDTSFITGTGFNNSVNSIAVQPDGKIMVGGDFTTYNGGTENKIIRLNSDGTKDSTFITGTGFNNSVNSIAVQPDGEIMVGGDFTTYNGGTENKIIRLNSDGTKDSTFITGTGFNNSVNSIVVQPDGKILVGGDFTTYNGGTENYIIRLSSDGTKDSTFNTGTGFNSAVNSIVVQPDGKILVGGDFTTYNGGTENYIIRLSSDGTKDSTFNTGTGFNSAVNSIVVQPDGKILVGGDFTTYNGGTENKIIRLNSDGTKGSTFITGTEFNNAVNSIAIQPDGKILVGGDFGVTNYIIRLNSDGTKDTTFNTGTGFNNYVKLIAVQPDGKILLGGDFTTYNGGTENYIIRLSSDGTKDSTFTTGIGFNAGVDDISIQPDGKILVGGNFTTYKGVTQNRIIRLNTDGTKDTTFTTGIGFNSVVDDIAIQSDGKILVGGLFTTYQGVTQNRIIRLNSDGTKDTTFNTGTGFNNPVYAIAIQPDGKILVGGNFTTYKGVTQNRIIRLNTDGTKDTTFNTGTGFNNYVFAIAIQPDGKILVGGYFTTYKGVTQNYIIRLNSDGSKDSTFNIGTGFNSIVDDIAIQSDGKILVGGSFTTYQGVTQNGIIRLNSDGTKDTTFNTGTGFNDFVSTITIQTDGKILVGGNFTTYQGNNQSAMLIGLHSGLILATENFSDSNRFGIYPNPVKDILTINSLDNDVITAVKIHDLQGKLIQETASTTIPLSNLSAGIYMVKVTTEKGEETKKFIKE